MSRAIKIAIATAFTASALAVPAFATVVNVGGGTWNYGTAYVFPTSKRVWSNYVHNSKYHSATSIIGSTQQKRFAPATQWANTSLTGPATAGTATYWATY